MEALPQDHRACLLGGASHHRAFTYRIYTTQRNNKLVWDETRLVMQDLFDNVWGDQREIAVEHAVDITLPVRPARLPSCPLVADRARRSRCT